VPQDGGTARWAVIASPTLAAEWLYGAVGLILGPVLRRSFFSDSRHCGPSPRVAGSHRDGGKEGTPVEIRLSNKGRAKTLCRFFFVVLAATILPVEMVCAADVGTPAALGVSPPGLDGTAPGLERSPAGPWAKGRILVAPNTGLPDTEFDSILRGHGAKSIGKIDGMNVHVVELPPGAQGNEQAVALALAHNPHVKFAEVDGVLSVAATANDPDFSSEWHLPKINAPTAWGTSLGTGVIIAILDTGVDGTHPDLAAQMVPGWNFYDNNSNTSDVYGHGTIVAGAAAAATNNGIGVASVAGGARIMPMRISDPSGYAYWSTVAQGITWAADHGARVGSLSYQGATASSTIISAAQYLRSKGGVLVTASGNTGALDGTSPSPYVMVVSATDQNDQRASWSSYGSFVDIAAPGVGILTTTRGGGYGSASGTSLATPIVAATAALVIAKRPDFAPSQVDSVLLATAVDLGAAGPDIYFGYGRVNAAAAVQQAAVTLAVDTTRPIVAIASPTGGTVSGTVAVAINASDNVGVARVDLRVNGAVALSDASSPYQYSWNSTVVANGTVTLTAVAYDVAGNSTVSAPITVNVSNAVATDTTAPTVAIASPTGGTVSGTVSVSVNSSDNVGVTRVDLRVNGNAVASSNVSPYKFSWNSTTVANGAVTLTAIAYDGAGNSRVSTSVSLNVFNATGTTASDTTPPTLTIANPVNGSVVNGNVTITTTAGDNSGTAGITQQLYIDGILKTSVAGTPLSYRWATQKIARGTHTIRVTARDKAGNSTAQQVQVTR
jgi:thermitase